MVDTTILPHIEKDGSTTCHHPFPQISVFYAFGIFDTALPENITMRAEIYNYIGSLHEKRQFVGRSGTLRTHRTVVTALRHAAAAVLRDAISTPYGMPRL